MFTTINSLKNLIIDLDSITDDWDSQWRDTAPAKTLFCGTNKQRLLALKASNEFFDIHEGTPFGAILFNAGLYSQILMDHDMKASESAIVLGKEAVLRQAQNAGLATIFLNKEDSRLDILPDFFAQTALDIQKIAAGEYEGYLAERCGVKYPGSTNDWQAVGMIRAQVPIDQERTCSLITAGRYYSQSDPRSYGHQLSRRILLHKWEETAQTSVFADIYRQMIENTMTGAVDAVTRIPPKDERQFDRFREITAGIAEQLGAEDMAGDLICVKRYGAQRTLNLEERKANVKDAFRMEKKVQNKHILLLDDILTSGATVREAARQLYACGAEQVTIAVLAIKQRKNNFLDQLLQPVRCRKCGSQMQLRINRTTQDAFFGCRELYNKEAPCTYIESYQSVLERRNADAGFKIEKTQV